nr:GNAT family N-acetyltransferase [Nocardioidaceae bacterium]
MIIRAAVDEDWAKIWPIFSLIAARQLWMEEAPAQTVVAVDGDVVLGSAKM